MRDLFLYLTTYSFALAVLSKLTRLPPPLVEYIRALVFVVFAAVLYIYAKYGTPALRSFYGHFFSEGPPPTELLFTIDIIVHFIVLFWIGLPGANWAIMAAYATFVGWYALVRPRIQDLYIKEIPLIEYDFLAVVVVPLILILYIMLKN